MNINIKVNTLFKVIISTMMCNAIVNSELLIYDKYTISCTHYIIIL